jgi:hypothetical protein
MALSQSLVLLIARHTAGSDKKGGRHRAYNRRLPDESIELLLKSKTHATWTHKGINILFTLPR